MPGIVIINTDAAGCLDGRQGGAAGLCKMNGANFSQGYRAPSPCIWRIESVTSKNEIVSVVPEALLENGSEGVGGRGSFLGRGGQGSNPRSSLLEDSSDEEDDEELSAIFESTKPEVQAITAVVDMLDGLGEDSVDSWNELLDGAAVAIASDSSKRTSELGPDDWELLPLVDILEEYGVLKVGGSPVLGGGCDLRPGHRLRLMVRDTQVR
ncbi:hypothetical protein DUNSADRAFT_7437 [Dunaliella salina]|uniref:Encoded protein n=1 Tax=Dunaliella salina TaxID=3046 RepID=A0ABQ7GLG0_DUNSA|nr:hypothetical protein DUNSADRAFT_7437 [Dunaliella salina]|eukprot:KAF5835449.1 hypothetical protein DUNSADRAFT_7437 [Dunaliella salina]